MDVLTFIAFAGSMMIVGYLARERRRSQSRWIMIALFIGPLAIPMLYLVVATSAVRKRIVAQKA